MLREGSLLLFSHITLRSVTSPTESSRASSVYSRLNVQITWWWLMMLVKECRLRQRHKKWASLIPLILQVKNRHTLKAINWCNHCMCFFRVPKVYRHTFSVTIEDKRKGEERERDKGITFPLIPFTVKLKEKLLAFLIVFDDVYLNWYCNSSRVFQVKNGNNFPGESEKEMLAIIIKLRVNSFFYQLA